MNLIAPEPIRLLDETQLSRPHRIHFVWVGHTYHGAKALDGKSLSLSPGCYTVDRLPKGLMYACDAVITYDKGWFVQKSRYEAPDIVQKKIVEGSILELVTDPNPILRYIGQLKHKGII